MPRGDLSAEDQERIKLLSDRAVRMTVELAE
jgi:hypothetical protein